MENAFEKACNYFEQMKYEEAMELFIQSYEENKYKNEIMELLQSCFLLPNKAEFKETYERATKDITKIQFCDLKTMFFPISDQVFYVYDQEMDTFLGKVDLTTSNNREKGMEFDSTLITDCWDIRVAQTLIGEKYPRCVYFLTNDENRTVSFLQIPGMLERFFGNYLILNSIELLKLYLSEMKGEYLPQNIISPNSDKYSMILNSIHKDRIYAQEKNKDNIFLSICIPSINRGGDAYIAVMEALKSGYDNEIEIVVSNNGSKENLDGYKKIKDIKDNRVRYYEAPENMGFDANIKKLIEVAQGKYIVFQSDQDRIKSINLTFYLNKLTKNEDIAVATSYGEGINFPKPKKGGILSDQLNVINGVMNQNYLTGLFLKRDEVINRNGLALYEKWRHNSFVRYYAHAFFLLIACREHNIFVGDEKLWIETGDSIVKNRMEIFNTLQAEVRMMQAQDAIELLVHIANVSDVNLLVLAENRYMRVFELQLVALYYYEKEFRESKYNWGKTCDEIYQWGKQVLDPYKEIIYEDNQKIWQRRCKEIHGEFSKMEPLK